MSSCPARPRTSAPEVKVRGLMDCHPFRGSFLALGDGCYKLSIKEERQSATAEKSGERVTVVLLERQERGGR